MIKVEQIFKSYGSHQVFEDFSLTFPEGKITAILGPSGCGKTTLLNILAGLIPVDQGKVETAYQVSYLFQEPRLLPWLTISQNIDLVLPEKMAVSERKEKIQASLKATGLAQYGGYYPSQLSGGMRQRAAMARAFSFDAPLLLMDEPFKSLDLKTRIELIGNFLELWTQTLRTVITVTHDVKEAMMLGDLILVLAGRPARVNFIRELPLFQTERNHPHHPEMVILEQQLYEQLLK